MLNLYGEPYYGGEGYYKSPREYEYLRQKKAYELARREQERRQQAVMEQRRKELLRQQEAKRVRLEREEYERQMAARNNAVGLEEDEPTYTVVRGRDGRLYRIPVEDDEYKLVQDSDGTIYRVRKGTRKPRNSTRAYGEEASPMRKSTRVYEEEALPMRSGRRVPVKHVDSREDPMDEEATLPVTNTTSNDNTKEEFTDPAPATFSKKEQRKKKKITVIVEDVTDDSDTEEDDYKSYWRNRHPGPHESWMEPVEL